MSKTPVDFDDFESFWLFEYDYRHKDNWADIIKDNSHLLVYYKTQCENNCCFITEWYYVLQKGNEKSVLGGFNIKTGFLNGDMKHDFDNSTEENEFRKKHLLGLSLLNLRSPFSLRGVARDSNGSVYTTETLERFTIDSEKMSIEEWSPF